MLDNLNTRSLESGALVTRQNPQHSNYHVKVTFKKHSFNFKIEKWALESVVGPPRWRQTAQCTHEFFSTQHKNLFAEELAKSANTL